MDVSTDTPPPPLPEGSPRTRRHRVANELNTTAIHAIRRARTADTESGLSPERLSVLSVLVYAGPATMSALAAAEQVSPPAITRIVQGLEADGLVSRLAVESDRRQTRVQATARGRRLLERARARRIDLLADVLADATGAELETVSRALEVIRRGLRATHR